MALPRTDLGAEEEEEKRRGLLTFRQCQVASTSASDSALTFSGSSLAVSERASES